jgi:hypothetical protein
MDEMDEELKSCLRTLEQRLCSDNDLLDYREELMPFKRWISRETIVRSFELEGGFFDAIYNTTSKAQGMELARAFIDRYILSLDR